MTRALFILPAAAILTCAGGQEALPAQRVPPRQVRLLPVGDAPPFQQEVRGGVRYELEPPAGSIPPRKVEIAGEDEKVAEVRLSLGRMSEPLVVPAGAGPLVLRQVVEGRDSKPWVQVQRPESGNFIVLVWRDPEAATWEKTRSMVLPDSPTAAPAGSLTIVNLSRFAVALVLGDEKLALPTGRPIRRRVDPGRPVQVQAGLSDGAGQLRRFASQTIEQSASERTWMVFYRADGAVPRQPVKLFLQRERAVAPAPP